MVSVWHLSICGMWLQWLGTHSSCSLSVPGAQHLWVSGSFTVEKATSQQCSSACAPWLGYVLFHHVWPSLKNILLQSLHSFGRAGTRMSHTAAPRAAQRKWNRACLCFPPAPLKSAAQHQARSQSWKSLECPILSQTPQLLRSIGDIYPVSLNYSR